MAIQKVLAGMLYGLASLAIAASPMKALNAGPYLMSNNKETEIAFELNPMALVPANSFESIPINFREVAFTEQFLNPAVDNNYIMAADSQGFVTESYRMDSLELVRKDGSKVTLEDFAGGESMGMPAPDGKIDRIIISDSGTKTVLEPPYPPGVKSIVVDFWQKVYNFYLRNISFLNPEKI